MDKQKAKEVYEDKVASGHTAAYASIKDDDEVKILTIFLGAIQPGVTLKVSVTLTSILNV